MYFQQSKLSKSEWEHCEVPVSSEETKILCLIRDGFYNTNIKYNDNQSIAQYMKIEHSPEIEIFLYTKYFKPKIEEMVKDCQITYELTQFINTTFSKNKQLKKMDIIRLSNLDTNIEKQSENIYEFVLLDFCKNIFLCEKTQDVLKKTNNKITIHPISFYIYNLVQLHKIYCSGSVVTNKWVIQFITHVIDKYIKNKNHMNKLITEIFYNSQEYIEKNSFILKYENKTLYDHQKQLFGLFNEKTNDQNETNPSSSRLVFYTAPTGTGKTLSPLGLSNKYKIIYICASRHIGLAFARNAISINKRVAFAFGCETASDIRLHYFSAKDYEINNKSGGIYKVDNSNGERVEIMICDLASYLVAMYYMLSFNNERECIMYWDEPTILMDVTRPHPLHETIHQIWKNNTISNIVLSCATLPTENELLDVIEDFSMKFDFVKIHTINSYECKKTLSLINKDKYTVLPHLFFKDHNDIISCVNNCRKNRSILRYFDLKEIIRFIVLLLKSNDNILTPLLDIHTYFRTIEEITMNEIKLYYLTILSEIPKDKWSKIYEMAKKTQTVYWNEKKVTSNNENLKKFKSLDGKYEDCKENTITRMSSLQSVFVLPNTNSSINASSHSSLPISSTEGIQLTTSDAHTLTDGVSIFFAEDVEKIGRFLIHQSKIPETVILNITNKILLNQKKNEQIKNISNLINDKIGKDNEKERKMEKDNFTPEVKRMMNLLESLKSEIHSISLEQRYIPNTHQHQVIWWDAENMVTNAFVPNIDQCSAEEVLGLDVNTQMKLLLLMGIGVFSNESNSKYMEIMKRLVYEERLYLIIANCNFIYGINYQMCHAFFGKDLKEMTQQKIIQAIGRIGRGNIQQEYTIRIRDDDIFNRLFLPQERNVEAENMCRLFHSK